MTKQKEEKRPLKKEAPQITRLNLDKAERKANYNRKHTREDKSKKKGIRKKNLRSGKSEY